MFEREVQLLVFDLDGTLIDSRLDIANSVNFTLAQFGIAPLPTEIISEYVGYGVMPLITATQAERGIREPEKALRLFGEYYIQHLTDHTKLYDGIESVLEHFAATPKVILTNKSNQFAKPIAEKLGIATRFLRCYGRESFPTMKPDPGPLLAICAEFKVPPSDVAMIGDTEADILCGKRAGAVTVAVEYGFGHEDILKNHEPDFQISSPNELKKIFRQVAL